MALLLFDIDGTLLNAHRAGRKHYEAVVAEVVGTAPPEGAIPFAGRTDPAIARDLLHSAGVAAQDMDEAVADLLHRFAVRFTREIRPHMVDLLPGIAALLAHLASRSEIQLGIVTGNLEMTGNAKLAAGGIDHYFPVGAFGSDHDDRNLLPGVARRRAEAHFLRDWRDDEIVVIGDTPHDVACGRHEGVRTVAVCTGFSERDDLVASRPDLLLDDLTQVDVFLDFALQT